MALSNSLSSLSRTCSCNLTLNRYSLKRKDVIIIFSALGRREGEDEERTVTDARVAHTHVDARSAENLVYGTALHIAQARDGIGNDARRPARDRLESNRGLIFFTLHICAGLNNCGQSPLPDQIRFQHGRSARGYSCLPLVVKVAAFQVTLLG
jgi:hypothetical protein